MVMLTLSCFVTLVVFDSYLHVYDKNNLTLISEFDTNNGPGWSTQNLVAKDDQLFVAVNNGFEWNNEMGGRMNECTNG